MSTASASKLKPGKVTVARDRGHVATAITAAGRGTMQVTWPPLMARVHHVALGGEYPEHAGDGVGLPGTPTGDGWLTQTALAHDVKLITIDAHLVRHLVENGISARALKTPMQRVADDTGADVLLLNETQPQPAPTPAVERAPLGETFAEHYAIGEVREVPPATRPGLPDLLRDHGATTIAYAGPDRLIAQRLGTTQDRTWKLSGADQSAASWLDDVILSYQPRLLHVDRGAISRADLDLEAVAVAHRVAVAVDPAPPTAGVTPKIMLEAHRAK